MKKIMILLGILLMINTALALPIYVLPKSGADLQPSTSFNYTFNFTTDIGCTDVVLSNSSTITTDQYGVGFIDINTTGITNVPKYLCEYVNDSLRKAHLLSDEMFRDVYASKVYSLDWTNVSITESQISDLVHTVNGTNIDVLDVNASSITVHGDGNFTGNLTIGQTITFALGEYIDNLVNGVFRVFGNFNMMQNNITNITKTSYINESYGIWSNETDTVIGYIEGL